MVLDDSQLERYARHIMLKQIGGAGQQKLLNAKVLVIGAGGLGCPLLSYLAAAGVGTIGIVDDDKVSLSNLQRQTLYATADVGRLKTAAAADRLAQLNPDCTIIRHTTRLTPDNALELINAYDVVADGCDNFTTRFLVNDACYFAQKPLVSAAVGQFDGQLSCFRAYENTPSGTPNPCYRSLVPAAPDNADEMTCAQTGIIGALTGVMGSLQALEVIKELTGAGETLTGRLLIYDALTAQSRIVRLPWDPANPLNGETPIFSDLSHHSG
ncbi:MAG: HesA/MoeB/ThiF family protein [Parvibaculales bacterium]